MAANVVFSGPDPLSTRQSGRGSMYSLAVTVQISLLSENFLAWWYAASERSMRFVLMKATSTCQRIEEDCTWDTHSNASFLENLLLQAGQGCETRRSKRIVWRTPCGSLESPGWCKAEAIGDEFALNDSDSSDSENCLDLTAPRATWGSVVAEVFELSNNDGGGVIELESEGVLIPRPLPWSLTSSWGTIDRKFMSGKLCRGSSSSNAWKSCSSHSCSEATAARSEFELKLEDDVRLHSDCPS